MRIISGKYRSRRITAPKGIKARPTTDFAKESLFNILNNWFDMDEIEVLDLFTGTGNISFEFGSRGAKNIIAVDISNLSYRFITSMASEMEMPIQALKADVFRFIPSHNGKYNVIFADPPYTHAQIESLPSLILKQDLLKPNGILVVEHDKEVNFESEERFLESRQYGRVNFSFFE
ncbi:MAG: 16S rRNA (guanine(966)-N(2))-methyltransferase RsmD [Flavobacteriales bacterium]|nr:16S rRNA (guanine(966)-N(2))-methyltransferase RsmD [Flavobacteriales bacterium]